MVLELEQLQSLQVYYGLVCMRPDARLHGYILMVMSRVMD